MAGAGAIRAGRAFIEFFGDDSKLNKVMNGIAVKMKSWGTKIAAVGGAVSSAGAAIEGPLVAAAKIFASTSHEVNRLSEMTGMGTDAVFSFMGAAKRAGIEIEDVTTGIKKMQKSIFEAAMGSESAQTALRHLGLSAGQLINMRPEDQFRLIAQRLAMIQNPAVRTGVALEIMGKSAATLIPLMIHLQELEARGKRSGPGITAADVKMGHELELSFMDLTSAMKKFVLQAGAAVAPIVKRVVDTMVAVIAKANEWMKNNRALVMTIFQISAVVIIVGGIITAFGTALAGLGFVVGGLAAGLSLVASILAFLISPIGLVIVAIVGLTTAFFTMTDMGQQALAFLGDAFTGFKDDALKAFNGVRDALASGNIALAFKVMGTFLSLQWAKVLAFLSQKWADFLNFLVPPAQEIAKAVAEVFIDMQTAIATAMLDAIQTIVDNLAVLGPIMATFLGPAGIAAEKLLKDLVESGFVADARAGLADENRGRKVKAGMDIDRFAKKIVSDADADAKAALDDVDKARTKFDDAVDKAAKGRKEFKPGEAGGLGLPFGVGDFSNMKAAVSGTFSAIEAAGLAGAGPMQKVADNTADMRHTLRQINAKQPGLGVV